MFMDSGLDPISMLIIALFIVILIVLVGSAIGIITYAATIIKIFAIAISILYFIMNLGFLIELFGMYRIHEAIIPIVARIARVAILVQFGVYKKLTGLHIPDIHQYSGIFETIDAALNVVFSFIIYLGLILIVMVIDFSMYFLELDLSDSTESIAVNHIISIVFSIVWTFLFFKFVY